jgi:hypothetical protein
MGLKALSVIQHKFWKFVILTVAANTVAFAGDSTLVPINQIPKLPEIFEPIDYKGILANGTLFPDRVLVDTISVTVGATEPYLKSHIKDTSMRVMPAQFHTREEQWQFIRELAYKNKTSMHYYILSEIYYDHQLFGWFKSYVWPVPGVGKLQAYLNSKTEKGTYRVWLLALKLDSLSVEKVKFKTASQAGLSLVRIGGREVEWETDKNRVIVYSRK